MRAHPLPIPSHVWHRQGDFARKSRAHGRARASATAVLRDAESEQVVIGLGRSPRAALGALRGQIAFWRAWAERG